MKIKKVLLGAALVAATTAALPVASAAAAEPYDGFGGSLVCFAANGRTVTINVGPSMPDSPESVGLTDSDPCMFVSTEGRVASRSRHWDSVAGYGEVEVDPDDRSRRVVRVQIDKVVLGTQRGVVNTSGARNSGRVTPPYVSLQGPTARWDRNCATNYHVAVYWSARLSNGQLKTGKVLGDWFKSPACS